MADISDKKLAESILQQLLAGAAVNGLRFGALQLLFDPQVINGEPYINLASAWVLYPVRPDVFPENETDVEEPSIEEEILIAVSLRHKVVVSVEILEPWPHLVLTFTDNSVLYLNGKNNKYEPWSAGLNGVPTDENIQIIACPGGGIAFFLPLSLSANRHSRGTPKSTAPLNFTLCPMKNLRNLIDELESLVAARPSNEFSNLFVEVRKNASETIISANQEGLAHIALQLLRLADKESLGEHYHIDESSIADTAETNVVLSFKPAPWA